MNIKKIVDSEQWRILPYHLTRVKQHNASLDRIEIAVSKRIAELERTNDELQATLSGQCFEILRLHLKGALEPMDSFIESGKSDAKKIKWYAHRCLRFLDEVAELKQRNADLEDALEEADQLIGNEEEDERQFHKDVQMLIHNKKKD